MERVREWLVHKNIVCRMGVPGSLLTTFGSGGRAALAAYPASAGELAELLSFLEEEDVPHRVLGAGSNVLFPDEGVRGVILRLDAINDFSVRGTTVTVGAGMSMPVFSRKCSEASLSGAEYAEGIPGKVGGAVYMNASAFGMGVSDTLRSVDVILRGERMTLPASELAMRYHRGGLPVGAVITSATFDLIKGERTSIADKMRENAEKRARTQPVGRSAGSVFRPAGEMPAALYIEETGLKGTCIGGAELSEKHCNFIVNRGGASTKDFFSLGERIRCAVREKTGVTLEYEVERIEC